MTLEVIDGYAEGPSRLLLVEGQAGHVATEALAGSVTFESSGAHHNQISKDRMLQHRQPRTDRSPARAQRRAGLVPLPCRRYRMRMDAGREFDIVMVAEPEGGYSVFVPELPSVATQGETIEEARANAQEAIEGYLEVMHEDDLPIPSVHRDRVAVHAA